MSETTTLSVSEPKITVEVSEENTSIHITPKKVTIEARGVSVQGSAGSVGFSPYNTITANNVQSALEQLADQDFRGDDLPSASNIEEGDTFYDKNDDQYKLYRETSPGVFQWVPIIVGAAEHGSDILDAGAF
jgi:hypothetical protein